MADPFSITAGAIGVSEAALSGISSLRRTIANLQNAPKEVENIRSSLKITQDTLASLETLRISDGTLSSQISVNLTQAAVGKTVNDCGEACGQFAKDLLKWTSRSSDSQMSARDRFSVGLWHRAKIERYKTQIQSCQSAVVFATTGAQFATQLYLGNESQVTRRNLEQQLQAFEERVTETISIAGQQRIDADRQTQSLENGSSATDTNEAERELAAIESDKQSRLLEQLQASCGVIYSQARSARTGQTIREVLTEHNSQAFVGMPESVVGRMEQLIEGVRTTGGSVAHIGVFKG